MFERLFGYTMEEQLEYLHPRVLFTALVIIIGCISLVFDSSGSALIAIAAYVWAWNFMKKWFGITTIGALFSGNIVVGVIMFFVYLFVGYFIGLATFLLALIRYIQLRFTLRR